jgi:uncharacterized protein (DUF433 family)
VTIRTSDDGLISSDPDIDGGQWRIAGTLIAVSDVRESVEIGDIDGLRKCYIDPYITDELIAACVAWTFPTVASEPRVMFDYDDIIVRCTCGENAGYEINGTLDPCPGCGKRWRVETTVTEVMG